MKRIIIIVVALLVLGGGGFAGWKYFLSAEPEAESEVAAGPPAFVELGVMTLPVIIEGRVTLHVTMGITLAVEPAEQKADVEHRVPRLRDAMFTELHGLFAKKLIRDSGYASPFVEQHLLTVTHRVLGDGTVSEVMLRELERRQPRRT